MSAKPAMKFRIGNLTATIWVNGEKFYTTVLTRAFKQDGEWQSTGQLNHSDLLNASALLQKCELYISSQQ